MNPNLERAVLLYQQSRHDLAEAELRQALAHDPQDAYAHALLALCLAAREKFDAAIAEARQAIHLAPDFPFAHYAHARVLYDLWPLGYFRLDEFGKVLWRRRCSVENGSQDHTSRAVARDQARRRRGIANRVPLLAHRSASGVAHPEAPAMPMMLLIE